MKNKYLLLLLTLALLVICLVACDKPAPDGEVTDTSAEDVTDTPTEPETQAPAESESEETTEESTEPETEGETLSPSDELAAILRSSSDIQARTQRLAHIASYGESNLAQGGYTDGKFHYQIYIKKDNESNEENNIDRLVKYDIEQGCIKQVSWPLPLNHANDMTYNPKRGVFVVVHNNPHRDRISLVDAETLTLVETIQLDINIYSIGYNEKRDEYAVGLSGGQTFCRLDANFKRVDDVVFQPTPLTEGYVTQGAACDDNFIYFVLYAENVITVYDWDGNFITIIHMTVQGEPENMTAINGKIYVATLYKKATLLYELTDFRPTK